MNEEQKVEAMNSAPDSAEAATPTAKGKKKRKKMSRKKFWSIIGIVVVVLVIAGAGMWKWHEEPSFCSTFCHIEADYVANYSQEQGVQGTDKYGNPVSNTNAMMSVLHRSNDTTAKPEIKCVDCHVPNMEELAHDGVNFVSGNYYLPRTERDGAALMKWDGKESSQLCANENCHSYLLGADGKVDRKKLEKTTAGMEFNPHDTHHANLEMQCTTCHKGHRASVVACTGCHEHENVEVPDGWLTYQQSQDLMAKSFGNK